MVAVGAKDGRVKAIVAQCPFSDGLSTLPALGLTTVMRVTVAGLRDTARQGGDREVVERLLAGAVAARAVQARAAAGQLRGDLFQVAAGGDGVSAVDAVVVFVFRQPALGESGIEHLDRALPVGVRRPHAASVPGRQPVS